MPTNVLSVLPASGRKEAAVRTQTIAEQLHTPLIASVDVLVMGGGPAGFTAALTAARLGASVMLIERWGHLGGLGTGGLVLALVGNIGPGGQWIKGGVYTETVERLRKLPAGLIGEDDFLVAHPEQLKVLYQRMLLEAGVKVLTNTVAVSAQVACGNVTCVMVENKTGRGAVKARVFIDASGDADSAPWCGVPFELLPPSGLRHMSLIYRLGNVDRERARQFAAENHQAMTALRMRARAEAGVRIVWDPTPNDGEVWCNDADVQGMDCSKAEDLMNAEFTCREKVAAAYEFYRAHVPGFEKAIWVDTAPQMGARESRRIRGRYWLTGDDCQGGRQFDDAVLLNNTHLWGKGITYAVPYRCMVPAEGPRNLLFAGRCISVEHAVIDRIREIPSCACLGQGAGLGAVLALKGGSDVGAIDTGELRKALADTGAILS